MFGLFKESITFEAFGNAIAMYACESIFHDADRSLGAQLPKADASNGWQDLLRKNGIGDDARALYCRTVLQLSVHAAVFSYPSISRFKIVKGSAGCFPKDPPGYNFNDTYTDVDWLLTSSTQPVNPTAMASDYAMPDLANPMAGILLSEFVFHTIANSIMQDAGVATSSYDRIIGPVSLAIATAHRASVQLQSQFRLVD